MKSKEDIEKEFERHYARTIGIVADEEIMSGKYADELLANKKEFLAFIHKIRQQDREDLIEWAEEQKMETLILQASPVHKLGYDYSEPYNQALQDLITKLKEE